jgi:hypothetical protein
MFKAPVIAEIALEEVLSEGCVQDMCKVIRGAEELKSLAQQYKKVGVECIIEFSWSTLTQSSHHATTVGMRSSNIFPSAMSLPHGPGHRWEKA